MKTLEILTKVLLITLMLLSVIGMFWHSETLEQFAMYWVLMMVCGVSSLYYYKITTEKKWEQ